jgi:hypothetical protein
VKFHMKETAVIVGVATAGTVIALRRSGLAIPALGPLSSPVVTILLGFVLAGVVDGSGTGGDVIEGIGYGLIAAGAISF